MEEVNAVGVLADLIAWIFGILGFVGVVGLVPFGISGIVYLVVSGNKSDSTQKAKFKKIGLFLIFLPIILIIGGLLGTIIIKVAQNI